ncbi:esterase/lipase family protein [Haloferula sp. A504]|uniref:esterase/lipase family protein n=1 Tax=Haloferula sp. A504 TaxID=3373601 RepID=UPI0031BD513A|nr:alpha/beta hydrolase [Verrucomicrobiaceae bacterium E54]
MNRRLLTLLPLLMLVASCAAPISVKNHKATPPSARVVPETTLASARTPGKDARSKLGPLLDALRTAGKAIADGDDSAVPEYNYLTARLVDHLIEAKVQPWQQAVRVNSGSTEYLLRGTEPADLRDPDRKFVPADRLSFEGLLARDTGRTQGVGAPLVSFLGKQRMEPRAIPYRTVTAVVRFDANVATLDLLDPFKTQSFRLGGRTLPLQADFNSPVAYGLSRERIDLLGFARLINPAAYDETERLLKVQPYDPDKIPVLLVHGLQDTPASFAPMYFTLMNDPAVRDRFQFWAFSYPSGYPYPMPAAALRKELDAMRQLHPDHKDLVIIGHSMGGLISRLMVTDVGERIWLEYFGTPPDSTEIDGESRQLLEDALVFDARPDIARAIFMSAPHRGSELATNIIGWIGIKLVRFPATLADVRDSFVNILTQDSSGTQLDRFPNSIDTLSPHNRFIKTINRFPIRSDIPYHTIVGDRGRGDTPDSSDGVVAYWSSHLDGAASEKIVPSNHSSYHDPQAIEEVRRILHLHAGLPYRKKAVLADREKREMARPPGRWPQ